MKVIGIVGSRRRTKLADYNKVLRTFWKVYKHGDMICSGGCPKGADSFAEKIAEKFDIPIKIFLPKWKRYGRIATFMRNTQIARKSNVLIACPAPDRVGGTEDTIKKFTKKFKKTNLILV
jgi:hypothetical protein